MRSFPDFAEIKAGTSRPMPDAVIARGRYLVGALALGGAFFIIGMAEPATASPLESSIALGAPAPASATPPRTGVNSAQVYKIAKGDSLSTISAKFGVSVPSLATVNGINNYNLIYAGRELLIPVNGATNPAPVKVTKAATPPPKAPATAASPKPVPANVTLSKASPGQPLPAELAASSRGKLNAQFDAAAKAYGVPPELLKAITYHESGWNNTKVSSTGAIGVGQLMPATIEFINTQLLTRPLDAHVPADNIKMSAAFLSYLLDETAGDQTLAAAAYYQGLGAVRNIGLYDDTKQYLQSINALRARYF